MTSQSRWKPRWKSARPPGAIAVLDLQSNKIVIMFGLSPTPSRALVVEFTRPVMQNTFTLIAKPGLEPKTWEELNKPEIRIAVDIGSTHDIFARRILPKATLVALKTPDEHPCRAVRSR